MSYKPETLQEQNAVKILQHFLNNELFNDHGDVYAMVIDSCEEYGDGELYIDLTIYQNKNELKSLSFKLVDVPEVAGGEKELTKATKIFITKDGDDYDEIERWNDSIKYFWMAFMEWPLVKQI